MSRRTAAAAGILTIIASACMSAPGTTPGAPRFSNPTRITNPYYPIATTAYAVRLGTEAGKPARIEVAVLPVTKTIRWEGGSTQTVVAHFAAYIDGELVETTYDYFAQADDGGVYYFGEDVSNYENGTVVNNDGTWLAGRNGTAPGLIMPAAPTTGDVYYPERLPGGMFERDEIVSTSERAETPLGPVSNGVKVQETLRDGSVEHKVFVPGIGIFEERTDDELLHTVLYVASGRERAVPASVRAMRTRAERLARGTTSAMRTIGSAWSSYAPTAPADGVPDEFSDALDSALAGGSAAELRAAVLDIVSVFQPGVKTDLARLELLAHEVARAAGAQRSQAATNRLAEFQAVWERALPFVGTASGARAIDRILGAQRKAASTGDFTTLRGKAQSALEIIEEVQGELE